MYLCLVRWSVRCRFGGSLTFAAVVSAGGFGGSLSARSARLTRRRSRRRAPAAGGRFAGRSLLLPCLPWAAAQHGSAAAAQGSEVAGR